MRRTCGAGVAANQRGAVCGDSNSAWPESLGRAPQAAISRRFRRCTRRGGFSSNNLNPGWSSRAVRTCSRTSSLGRWPMWSDPCPRRAVDGVGGAQPRRCKGGERSSLRTVSLARGWWRGHRAERWTVFELLVAHRAPLVVVPGVWGMEGEHELTIAGRHRHGAAAARGGDGAQSPLIARTSVLYIKY